MNSKEKVKIVYAALEEKKAEDIRVIDISNISIIADYFIVANGTNSSQVRALVDNVDEKLGRAGVTEHSTEGLGSDSWILMDYGDVIVHVFDKENRVFYNLERIWTDGKDVSIEELEK